jgi:thiol-disulfide isomerase/thioredoxin
MQLPAQIRSVLAVVFDLLAGVIATVFVLGAPSQVDLHGFDFRVMYAATATGFFCAGLLRGKSGAANLWLKALLISAPGIAGVALLIWAQGRFRLSVFVGLGVMALLMAAAGVATRRRKSWRLGALSLAASTLVILVVIPHLSSYSGFTFAYRPAPSFTVYTFDGRPIRNADLRGKVVVLAFWATWCGPCHAELPEVERVYTRFKNNADVEVIAVDTAGMDEGSQGDDSEGGKKSLARMQLDLPGAFDSGEARYAFDVRVLPTLVVLDREGNVRLTHTGFDVSEHLDAALSAQINFLLQRHE